MSNFFTKAFQRREVTTAPVKDAEVTGGVVSGSFSEKVEKAGGINTSPTVAAWYRGVELRANAMSQLRMEYQQKNKKGGNFVEYDRGEYGLLNYLLQVRPCYYENAAQMRKRAEILKIMAGNAYYYIEMNDVEEIKAIHLALSGTYNPETNTYDLIVTPKRIAKTRIPADRVIHIRNTFTDSTGTIGIPTLQYAARALNIAATNDKQTLDNAAKGGRFKLLLKQAKEKFSGVGAKLNEKQMQKRKDDIEKDLYRGDVGIVPFGTEIETISMTAQDMQILENRKFSVAEVGRFLGIPSSMLNDLTNTNYKTAEHATLELFRTLAPAIHEEECEWNGKILLPVQFGVQRFHLCEKPLFRLDLTSQAAWNKNRLETGCATVNELRAEQDMPTVEGGNKLLLSANLKTMEMLEKEGTPTTPAPEPTPTSGEEGGEE